MATYKKTNETNWLRVCKLLIEVGRDILLDYFQRAVQPLTLRQWLLNKKSDIIQYRKDKTLYLNNKQFKLLYYGNNLINTFELESEYRENRIAKWDITLISRLLNYFSENGILTISDSEHDSHNKIRKLRNNLFAHSGENGFKMTDSEFEIHWHDVVKVLTESVPFNIQDKIRSVQKEEIVDGDKLNEILTNWKLCDKEILDRLDKIEKTIKQGHAETQQKLAKIEQQIQYQDMTMSKTIQNTFKGAVATDRMLDEMPRDVDTLQSEASMDAEPNEGNSPNMTPPTLPASSGNTAADGESVLANLLPKMTVNEPDESRDESASSLQSNLLTEQRSHNEMPPTIGYIDCLIFYNEETDRQGATKFKEHLINDIKINKHGPVVALLYDDSELSSLPRQEIAYFEEVCKLSTIIMLYMTNAFFHHPWEKFKTYACLMNSITNKSPHIVPVYAQEKEIIDPPSSISSIRGYYYYNNKKFDRDSLANDIEGKVETRVERNKRLEIEKQQRRDKEIVDSHPQQDAFVQTSGQTPGTSAGIQEVNTIPDLEEDTTDDVDLASSSHDDKMEQKEEAQVASLAEIKQKKKKKKKKKTRR